MPPEPGDAAAVDLAPTFPAPVRLVCLDMAGTTVDDGSAVLDSFASAVGEVGLVGSERDAALGHAEATMGRSKIDVFREILGDESTAQAANDAFESAYQHVVAAGAVRAMAGAVELFTWCRERGIRVCLTTGFAPPTRTAIVEALGWEPLIDLALSPSDAGRGRPFPDMVLTAVLRLGIDDVRHVAVAGDTTNDLWSGHHAGASIVAGVLTGVHDGALLATAPHTHLLASVADLADVLAGRMGA